MSNTHIKEGQVTPPTCTGKIDLNNDGIGYIESWDFSKANMSAESRIFAITKVASVCYSNEKAIGSISLYDRLACESASLPSSSFEFVPVLLKPDAFGTSDNPFGPVPVNGSSVKYGEFIPEVGLLTNLRALMADVGDQADQFFNTEEECAIIAKHFKVYQAKIDIATRTQYIRHRVSWQELSRRYVSGKKSQFEFYISPKMRSVSYYLTEGHEGIDVEMQDYLHLALGMYDNATAQGVKPEEARRILPQNMYTTIWSAWQPSQLDSYLALRTDKHTQVEHRELAEAMKVLRC